MTSMPAGKVFLDANILIYAQDQDSPDKQRRSREVIAALADSGAGVISTQVLQEYYVTVTRKLGVAPLAAKSVLQTFKIFEMVQASPDLIDDAIDCSVLNTVSFWDALIIAAAASSGCAIVYSEDLNPGQTIQGVRIENPLSS
jgi:predicted nucleic acid-binding protein